MKSLITITVISILFIQASLVAGHHKSKMKDLPVTAEEQAVMTPDAVLAELKAGNARYLKQKHTKPNAEASIKAAAKGQWPMAYVLSCVDSRVPVELVLDQGIGDIFVGRVAGNVENEDQLGSMEFASAVAGVKLIVVMGHEACGAVKGACDHVKLGNLSLLLEKIAPAVSAVDGYEGDERTSKNSDFVTDVVHANVEMTVADIRERSAVLSGLEAEGKIKIVGAYYSLANGKVSFKEF